MLITRSKEENFDDNVFTTLTASFIWTEIKQQNTERRQQDVNDNIFIALSKLSQIFKGLALLEFGYFTRSSTSKLLFASAEYFQYQSCP